MQNTAQATEGAKKRVGKSLKIDVPLSERAAYSPNEFAALFGKQTTWGYRMLYRGRVRAIKSMGRIMIPASEVQRLQSELATLDELLEQRAPANA
jgi:hypothetical protein